MTAKKDSPQFNSAVIFLNPAHSKNIKPGYMMIKWFRKNPIVGKIVVGVWAFFATVVSLYLGVSANIDRAALDRLDAREKIDKFMTVARSEYHLRCVRKTQSLRPTWQLRFDSLVEVAKVDVSKPPYNAPCRIYPKPGVPTNTSLSMLHIKSAAQYSDWESFISKKEKIAILWVGDVPFGVDISNTDFLPLKERYLEMISAEKKCESKEQSKTENTYIKVDCIYNVGENNNIELRAYESMIKSK